MSRDSLINFQPRLRSPFHHASNAFKLTRIIDVNIERERRPPLCPLVIASLRDDGLYYPVRVSKRTKRKNIFSFRFEFEFENLCTWFTVVSCSFASSISRTSSSLISIQRSMYYMCFSFGSQNAQ